MNSRIIFAILIISVIIFFIFENMSIYSFNARNCDKIKKQDTPEKKIVIRDKNITYAIQIHNNIENDKEQENYLDSSTPQTILLTNGIEKLDINWWFTTS